MPALRRPNNEPLLARNARVQRRVNADALRARNARPLSGGTIRGAVSRQCRRYGATIKAAKPPTHGKQETHTSAGQGRAARREKGRPKKAAARRERNAATRPQGRPPTRGAPCVDENFFDTVSCYAVKPSLPTKHVAKSSGRPPSNTLSRKCVTIPKSLKLHYLPPPAEFVALREIVRTRKSVPNLLP